ncbi:MAG: hypothetical protein OXF30_02865 [Candidatus Saccharibacteria bacterium]|nr:hypothetical protein [Candidatus Saccharibacteria bacterium]
MPNFECLSEAPFDLDNYFKDYAYFDDHLKLVNSLRIIIEDYENNNLYLAGLKGYQWFYPKLYKKTLGSLTDYHQALIELDRQKLLSYSDPKAASRVSLPEKYQSLSIGVHSASIMIHNLILELIPDSTLSKLPKPRHVITISQLINQACVNKLRYYSKNREINNRYLDQQNIDVDCIYKFSLETFAEKLLKTS